MTNSKMIRTTEDSQHFHRWRIEEPDGPVSGGVCRDCGATQGIQELALR